MLDSVKIKQKEDDLKKELEEVREELRNTRRHQAATLIQVHWRGHMVRKNWPQLHKQLQLEMTRLRPRPIAGTPEPGEWELEKNLHMSHNSGPNHALVRSVSEQRVGKCDLNIIQNTCSLFGLDLVRL